MATLFLICGLPGSGKAMLAKQIERDRSALRLSPDEWIEPILADVTDIGERDRFCCHRSRTGRVVGLV